MGMKIGQVALRFGCNDFGSLMIEENVVSAANTTHRTSTDGGDGATDPRRWIHSRRGDDRIIRSLSLGRVTTPRGHTSVSDTIRIGSPPEVR